MTATAITLAGARATLETTDRENLIETLKAASLGNVREIYEAAGCEPNRSPNKTFLARRIADAIEAAIEAEAKAAETEKQMAEDAAFEDRQKTRAATADPTDGLTDEEIAQRYAAGDDNLKPRHLNVEQLRRAYEIAVGRTTGSTDRGYLVWKIREALKGNITVGAIERKTTSSSDQMALPFRVARDDVPTLDAAWEALGFKSRMDFLRHAVAFTLSYTGNGIPAALAGWFDADKVETNG